MMLSLTSACVLSGALVFDSYSPHSLSSSLSTLSHPDNPSKGKEKQNAFISIRHPSLHHSFSQDASSPQPDGGDPTIWGPLPKAVRAQIHPVRTDRSQDPPSLPSPHSPHSLTLLSSLSFSLLLQSSVHSFVRSFVHSFVHPSVRLFVCSSVSFIYLLIVPHGVHVIPSLPSQLLHPSHEHRRKQPLHTSWVGWRELSLSPTRTQTKNTRT